MLFVGYVTYPGNEIAEHCFYPIVIHLQMGSILQLLIKSCTIPLYCALGRRCLEFLSLQWESWGSFLGTEARNKGYEIFNRILHLPLTSVFPQPILRKTLLVRCLWTETEDHWRPKITWLSAYCVLNIVHSPCFPSSQRPPFCNKRKSRLGTGITCSPYHSSWEAEAECEIKPCRLYGLCTRCHSIDSGAGDGKG